MLARWAIGVSAFFWPWMCRVPVPGRCPGLRDNGPLGHRCVGVLLALGVSRSGPRALLWAEGCWPFGPWVHWHSMWSTLDLISPVGGFRKISPRDARSRAMA